MSATDTLQNWSLNAALELANRRTIFAMTVREEREIIEKHAEVLRIRIAALEIKLRGLSDDGMPTPPLDHPDLFETRSDSARHDFHD